LSTLFIQAMNVHVGGGASLLRLLLNALPVEQTTVVLIDERMVLAFDLPHYIIIKRVKPTLVGRWRAERWLRRVVNKPDTLLCFGNLPPLTSLKCQVIVFVQNRFLIEDVSLSGFSLKTRFRLRIERCWLSCFARNGNLFVVQTPSMQRLLSAKLGVPLAIVQCWPYANISSDIEFLTSISTRKPTECIDFIYPASGDSYKNHRILIEAWSILAQEGIFPSLYVTVDQSEYPELFSFLELKKENYGLNIVNLGFLSHDVLLKKYEIAKALIYPSIIESFGLPLIEAKKAGLPILAAELDYVRDILDPSQSFNPLSAMSIARAVRRFLGQSKNGVELLSAEDFVQRVLDSRALKLSSKCILN